MLFEAVQTQETWKHQQSDTHMDEFAFENDLLFKPGFDDFAESLVNQVPTHNGQGFHEACHEMRETKEVQEQQKRTRASGEVLALLISEFSKNPNPNIDVRRRISEQTGMAERSVRIWFQNRRAKSRKLEKAQAGEQRSGGAGEAAYASAVQSPGFSRYDGIPLGLNTSYFFLDARSLTVGSWKRLKSGSLSTDNVFSVRTLSNLSPQSINAIMHNSTDLMVLISKKNFEINYFFSAISESSKILFRIFFPLSAVSNCSISVEDASGERECELKLLLKRPPKFAVSFAHLISQNNQWSICEDFSEGHQVGDAFAGGSGIPHSLRGLESSLKFMSSFILDYNSSNITQAHFDLPRPSQSPTAFPEASIVGDTVFVEGKYEFDSFIQQPDDSESGLSP